jgi:hypothetical protein
VPLTPSRVGGNASVTATSFPASVVTRKGLSTFIFAAATSSLMPAVVSCAGTAASPGCRQPWPRQ